MDVRGGLERKLNAKELMLLNCVKERNAVFMASDDGLSFFFFF